MSKEQDWHRVEEPVCTKGDGRLTNFEYRHPAYATIGASRVSGHTSLFQSEFNHQHYVTVRISPAKLSRSLAQDWVHETRLPYIEVHMSEAQWATFVSSMNNGTGVPCTLGNKDGIAAPRLPPPKPPEATFKSEVEADTAAAMSAMRDALKAVDGLGISKKKAEEVRGKIVSAMRKLDDSLPFIAGMFSEHMENTVEKAKVEVNAYATQTINRLGLDALKLASPISMESLDGPRESE